MKNPAKLLLLFLLSFMSIRPATAQKRITEGTVTYSVTYDLPADKQQYASALPNQIVVYFRGDSTAAVVNQGGADIKGVSVIKSDYHSLIIDIPANGKKIVVVMTPDEVAQEKAAIPQFTGKRTGEKQSIDGYNCEKVILTDPKSGVAYENWVTNDISIPPTSVSRGITTFGGVPVRFVTFNSGIKLNADIKSVQPQTVPAGFFTASKDYTPMSYTDLKSGGAN